jgi:hypothetical protein
MASARPVARSIQREAGVTGAPAVKALANVLQVFDANSD